MTFCEIYNNHQKEILFVIFAVANKIVTLRND